MNKANELENIIIDELNLPSRVINALLSVKIETVADLIKVDKNDLIKIKGVGKKFIDLIEEERDKFRTIVETKIQPEDKKQLEEIFVKNLKDTRLLLETKQLKEKNNKYITLHKEIFNFNLDNFNKNTYLKSILKESQLIDELPLPARLINSLNKNNLYRILDICSTPLPELIKIRGLGKTSLIKLSEVLNNQELNNTLTLNENLDLIDTLINRINNREDKIIISKRYGFFTGERMTLEEIGQEYKLTRERIRQRLFKSIKQLRHPLNPIRPYFINLVESLILKNNGVITDDEADEKMFDIIKTDKYDGSCILDLLVDLNWINRFTVSDTLFYLPKYKLDTELILTRIINLIKNSEKSLTLDEILLKQKFENISTNLECDSGFISSRVIFQKLLKLNPKLEEIGHGQFIAAIRKGRSVEKWIKLIEEVLQKSNRPLHFSEISNIINTSFTLEKYPDIRRIHSILVEYSQFAHTGTKGMYGLTKWGFKKEPTIEIVKECIKTAGYRIHWKQIYEYVSRFKKTSKMNIRSILETSGKFEPIGEGSYNIKEK